MELVNKADELLSKSTLKMEKIIKLYQEAIPLLQLEEQLEVYKKLVYCYH